MAFQRLSNKDRQIVNSLRDRAWAAGLEITFSQIAKDPDAAEERIIAAEAAKKTATQD